MKTVADPLEVIHCHFQYIYQFDKASHHISLDSKFKNTIQYLSNTLLVKEQFWHHYRHHQLTIKVAVSLLYLQILVDNPALYID